MKLTAIVAIDQNRAIGCGNQLIWRIKADLRRFKKLTTNKTIVMGRKTFESIGRALPDRKTVVITRRRNWRAKGVITCNNVEDLAKVLKEGEDAFVVGGGEIYELLWGYTFEVKLTLINTKAASADAWFPDIFNDGNFHLHSESELYHDDATKLTFKYLDFRRVARNCTTFEGDECHV